MVKPVLLTVDDDPEVLRAIERDLKREYGDRFRVMGVNSGSAAHDLFKELKVRNHPLSMILTDHRMPHMEGVELLEMAIEFFPEAKRVLLTAYADTTAAIRAINAAKIDYYLLKPWDPPKERLYPVLNDLLDDWLASFRPPFEGIHVISNRWAHDSHRIKDFLARHQIPYQWMDIEADAEACRLYVSADQPQLPLVVFPDGTRLSNPHNSQLAEKISLTTRAQMPFYDLIIVGGGPAGLGAAVYGASEGLHTVMIEREAPGGQAGTSSRIENYLGFPVGLSGADLARRAVTQAKRFGAEILAPQEVTAVHVQDQYRLVTLSDGTELSCHALLIATGVSYRKLEIPGIEELTGAGVYYGAAITESLSCTDSDVFIVGGANSAGQAALHLAKVANKVTILVRGDSLTKGMSQYLIDEIAITSNIEVKLHSSVVAVKGEGRLEAITIADAQTGEIQTVPATAMFIFIGARPLTEWLGNLVARDEYGFILSGRDLLQDDRRPKGWSLDRDPYLLETSVPGIFVAGDVRHGSVKRVASGVGEGANALQFIHQYLARVR